MLSFIKTVAIILLLAGIVALIVFWPTVSQPTPQPKEVPCEELVWMRDAPQARCVEYWKLQDKAEEV